jgi:integrase
MGKRRTFGNVRRQANGRWQVRYKGPDGRERQGERTFPTKKDAEAHLSDIHSAINRGTWSDPRSRALTLASYADEWIKHRPLALRTRELYDDLLRLHIKPQIGDLPIGKITPAEVRRWHAERRAKTGRTRLGQAYKLLKTMLADAVKDGLLPNNPCQITGAGSPPTPERPYMSREQMELLSAAMPEYLRALVPVTFYAHLRLGELLALKRSDVDLDRGTVHVRRAVTRTKKGPVEKDTKTGHAREVYLPRQAVELLREHMEATGPALPFVQVFRHKSGGPLLLHHVRVAWNRAREATVLERFHLHDLRHAGLTYVAQHGASLRHIQARAGHKTVRAAMIYQHVAEELDADLAGRMSDQPQTITDEGLSGS